MSFGGRMDRVLDLAGWPGLVPSRVVGQADGEFITIGEFAGDCLAGWQSDRDGCRGVTGIEHPLFQVQSAKTPGHARQITGRRMAGRASPRTIEILFARLDVAGLKVADLHTAASTGPRVGL